MTREYDAVRHEHVIRIGADEKQALADFQVVWEFAERLRITVDGEENWLQRQLRAAKEATKDMPDWAKREAGIGLTRLGDGDRTAIR